MPSSQKRFLIGHLNSNGDCLYATTVAKQIKVDFPCSHITWAIGSSYKKIIQNNPYVDEVWEIPLAHFTDAPRVWEEFKEKAVERQKKGDFDEIYLTQLINDNLIRFDGTIRSSILNGYRNPITVSVQPVLFLNETEIEIVSAFAIQNNLKHYTNVVLFECAPMSLQALITPEIAYDISKKLIEYSPSTCVILSSNKKILLSHPNILDGSSLSLRENAELTKYCTLLVGCSSGITWVSTSSWAKKLPFIQLLNPKSLFMNSVVNDHRRWGLPVDHIAELPHYSEDSVLQCIKDFIDHGIEYTVKMHHKPIPIGWHSYQYVLYTFLKKGKYGLSFTFVLRNFKGILPFIFLYSYLRFFLVKLPRKKLKI